MTGFVIFCPISSICADTQKALFENEFYWSLGGKSVKHSDRKVLVLYPRNRDISRGHIKFSSRPLKDIMRSREHILVSRERIMEECSKRNLSSYLRSLEGRE